MIRFVIIANVSLNISALLNKHEEGMWFKTEQQNNELELVYLILSPIRGLAKLLAFCEQLAKQ